MNDVLDIHSAHTVPWQQAAAPHAAGAGYDAWLERHNTGNIADIRALFADGGLLSAMEKRLSRDKPTTVMPLLSGSDGRGEKGPISKACLVIVADTEQRGMTGEEGQRLFEGLLPKGMFDAPEVKPADGEGLLYFKDSDESRHPWPERLLGAQVLLEEQKSMLHATQLRMREAFMQNTRKVMDKHRQRLRDSTNVCLTGKVTFKKQTTTHFDMEEGVAHFEPDEYVTSFKQGPVRLTQHYVTHRLLRLLRDHQKPADIIDNQPQGTVRRLEYLAEHGVLPARDAREAGEIYLAFLELYHRAQWLFAEHGRTTSKFDKDTVKEHNTALLRLLEVDA